MTLILMASASVSFADPQAPGTVTPKSAPASPKAAAPKPTQPAQSKLPPSPFKAVVDSAEGGDKFLAYVGGGANISPPDTFGGGGGIPLISISNGTSFMAGEISSRSEKIKLVKVALSVTNSGQTAATFKIGDVRVRVGAASVNDFVAAGYNSRLCAMSDEDRKKVKQIAVTLAPGESSSLSYAFPIDAGVKGGELLLGNSAPVPFVIGGN